MPDRPAKLRVRLFGSPEVLAGTLPLVFNNQKARALIFYLAATGQAHSREHLAALLWSDALDSEARHSLRSSLYQLRQTLRAHGLEHVLVAEGDLLRLELDPVGCDVQQFSRLLASGSESDLAQAVSLYRGPLLQGFTLSGAPLFEEWARFEELELGQGYLQALERLVAEAERRQEWGAAIGFMQRIVQLDPLAEEAQQRLISLFIRNGALGQALRQYRQFEEELRRELNLAPAPETQALLQQLQQQQRSTPPPVAPAPRLAVNAVPGLAFVDRNGLLPRLLELSQEVAANRGTTLLLEGQDGMGKSRLVEELINRLVSAQRPWSILRGSCSPFDDIFSFGPFLEALHELAAGDVQQLLADPHDALPDGRARFFWRVFRMLSDLAQSGPLVLVIEDLHWASGSTVNLFGFLSTRLRGLPVLLIGTVQRSDALPALQQLVAVGRRRGELQVLPLPPFSEQEVLTALRRSGLTQGAATTLAGWLHRRADGNPFLIEEILTQLRGERLLIPGAEGERLDPGRWLRWRTTFSFPETTHDLMAWCMSRLSATAHQLLDTLAVAGHPLELALLRDVIGIDQQTLLRALDELVSARLVVEVEHSTLALAHHLLAEVVLARVGHLRQHHLHAALAQALERSAGELSTAHIHQLARHAVAGADAERAWRYGLQVLADIPDFVGDPEAIAFLIDLYALVAPALPVGERMLLARKLARTHHAQGQLDQAQAWHCRCLELAHEVGDRLAEASAHFELGVMELSRANYAVVRQEASAGLACCAPATSPELLALSGRGYQLYASALMMEGQLDAAETAGRAALAIQRQLGQPFELAVTILELGNIKAQRGALREALALYEEAASTAESGASYITALLAYNNIAYHRLLLGEIEAAQVMIDRAFVLAEIHQIFGETLHLWHTQGEIHLARRDWAAAREAFENGLPLAEAIRFTERQAGFRAGMALAARGLQQLEEAVALFQQALELLDTDGALHDHLRIRILLALAETHALCANSTPALRCCEQALQLAQSQGRLLLAQQADSLRAQIRASLGQIAPAAPPAERSSAQLLETGQETGP